MRSSDLRGLTVILAALFGAAACSTERGTEPAPEGGDGGTDATAGTPDDSGADGAGGAETRADGASAEDDASAEDGASCGTIPPPSAWSRWIMPNSGRGGLPNPASYTVSNSGNLVTDNVTGLVWQRNMAPGTYTWDDAKQYCACLSLDGSGGWRLPSRIELASIADASIPSPSIDSSAFPGTPSESFWTATMLSSDPLLAYLVYFGNGHTSYAELGYDYHARCVREGSSPTTAPPERYAIANGTVHDTVTKLTWQQEIPTSLYTWADATTYCSALSLDGTGWRVPAINELQTIVDESTNPSIDGTAFPMTPSEYFWSSQTVVEDPSRAWTCFFSNGSTYSFGVTTPRNIRCVR